MHGHFENPVTTPQVRRAGRRLRAGAAIGLTALSAAFVHAVTRPDPAGAQPFVEVFDAANPIVTDTGVNPGSYSGACWVDMNGDGRDDLFVNRRSIYRNDGGGVFTKITPGIAGQGSSFGTSWSDVDNDGDDDAYVSGGAPRGSFLYRNDGGGTFAKITTGVIGDSLFNSGWGCAWADYDNDGFTDVAIAAPFNFAGITHKNRLLHNNGDGTFTNINTTDVTDTTAPYTVPSWYDHDDDGDFDLFIGSGPANGTLAPDYLFRNTLVENGTPGFERITTGALATDPRDGQNINWIDYDNDEDADVFVTNYGAGPSAGIPNDLYRNDGGTLVKMTGGDVGAIASDDDISLGNTWDDFDNDGDLDCYVTNEGGATCRYYANDGDGTFTAVTTGDFVTEPGPHFAAVSADYDEDGDLDLFVSGVQGAKSLYRNDLAPGNAWVAFDCVGTVSNRAAIGTRLVAIATLGGSRVVQRRDVSAQNAFNGHSSLAAHFGLRDAAEIDSLIIRWPRGLVEVYTNVQAGRRYVLVEGTGLGAVGVEPAAGPAGGAIELLAAGPNPFRGSTLVGYRLARAGEITLSVFDAGGRKVATLVRGRVTEGAHQARFAPPAGSASGVYFCRLEADGQTARTKIVLLK